MTFLKPSRLPILAGLLCLLLVGFAATSYGVVRWDVVPSPTEVITYGRLEVLGSVTFFARGNGQLSGTSSGGNAQIGIIFTNPSVQIDNTTASGIHLAYNFAAGVGASAPTIVLVDNFDLNGRCTGRVTINIPYGITVNEADFIRLEGVRGRIDQSLAITAGTDLYADLQSINDPSANLFTPDRVRVAKSFCPMFVKVKAANLLLCFPTTGIPNNGTAIPGYSITVTEGFARAFVDRNSSGVLAKARVDSAQALLGAPTNNTWFMFWLQDIPVSVSTVTWPSTVTSTEVPATSNLTLVGTAVYDTTTGTSSAIYQYNSNNQTDISDITLESFVVQPVLRLLTGATATGTVNAGVWLYPFAETATACAAPSGDATTPARPRFLKVLKALATCNNPPDDPVQPYATIIRCNCYMLFTYVTATPGATGFNTGIAIANTTGDTEVFGTGLEAPNQLGKITFYFYDKDAGYKGSTVTASDILSGKSFVDLLSNILPTGVTSFSGYIIARADFQFCHGFAYISDNAFAAVAHGYIANIIPDPAIKGGVGGRRTASDAGDITNLPAGEGLNN